MRYGIRDIDLDEESDDEGQGGSPTSDDGRRQEQLKEGVACIQDVRPEEAQETVPAVAVWWFPGNFSQSRFGTTFTASSACTIIALLVAEKIHTQGIHIFIELPSNIPMIRAFAACILEGNSIYKRVQSQQLLNHSYLTVPEAIAAAASKMQFINEWCSLLSERNIFEFLYKDLKEKTDEWYSNTPQQCSSDLYVVLIADCRSVLIVFQKELDKVTLIDSHQHGDNTGAVMAQVTTDRLQKLCEWYVRLLRDCYNSDPTAYELSYMYFRRSEAERGGRNV